MRSAVVLASAPGALEELALAPPGTDVLAVNQAGLTYLGPIVAWGSVHADQLAGWLDRRAELGAEPPLRAFGESFLPGQDRERVRYYGPVRWSGSSALYVAQWALDLGGYDRLALAGVRLGGRERQQPDGVVMAPNPYEIYRGGWIEAKEWLADRVRSFGGWTQELLGAPPPDWFNMEGLHGEKEKGPSC